MDLDQETEIPQAEGAPQQNAYPPAVSNIAQEINNHTPVWRVILLFLIFQPITLFIIFKEKYYHSWIAFLLWLHAILLLIVYIIMKISVLPQLESLYKNLNLTGSFPIINLLLIVFIIFMLAQIIFGIFVFYKNRLIGYLSKGLLAATLVFFIIDLFISPAFIIIGLLNPLYNLISSVEKQTTIEAFQLSPTPTPDPTTNWKTYANYQSKFTFKYPSNANVQSDISENIIYITTLNKPYFLFSLKVENNLENLTAKQYVDNELRTLRLDNYPGANALADKRQTTIKDYNIEEMNGIYMRGGSDGDSVTDFIEIITVNNNYIYKFMIHDGNGAVDEHQKRLMDQILSTFKFLE